jgi:hypothetical protein
MPHIVLTEEQARVIEQTTLPVEVRDQRGRVLVQIPAASEEQIIERIGRNRDPNAPRYSSAEVLSRLQKLQEISEREELDEAKVKDLLRRMRAGEEV